MHRHAGTNVSAARRRAGHRWATRAVGLAVVLSACLGVAPGVASAAPVAPSDAELSAAQQAEQAAAAEVGEIAAALATAQAAADAASAQANIALQDYEEKQSAYDQARAAADAAAAASAQAEAELQGGRDEVASFARDSYKQGSTSAGALALMNSGGPTELLERAALIDAAGEHRVDVVARLTVLEEQATAADQAAQQSVAQADALKAEAATLLATAQQQEIVARSRTDALAVQADHVQAQLDQAQQEVTGLEGERAAAQAYAAEQQRTAAAAAAAAAAQSPSSPARSTSTASTSGSSARSSSGPSVNSSSSASAGSSSGSAARAPAAAPAPVATTAGAPTGSAVQTAIAAARSQLGVAYSWGGGGPKGPSYGISPDTGVWGFDCSGLTQYAYARAGVAIGGTSREQYRQFRNNTVAVGDLQPGDLLFWDNGSSGATIESIVHVALYIGGNQMIEAPDRGLSVVVSKARTTSSTYFGAVRPTG